jgi:3'(2'), 5'-bisphosphate nucleotidase
MSFTTEQLSGWLPTVVELADAAGTEILRVYDSAFSVTFKDDRSPLTEADLGAQRIISAGLTQLTPDIGVLGEESAPEVFRQRRAWSSLWLVDPLDGTREFVKRNGEFTVNIALIEAGEPVLGVVYAPAKGMLYAAARGAGAWRRDADGKRTPVQVSRQAPPTLRILGSRSHGDAVLERMLERLGAHERVSIGSALKFGLLADGRGDLYVRRGTTCEWDTAAGQAVVLEAGGCVVDFDGQPLRYNQHDHVTNPSFIAYADRSRDWAALLAAPATANSGSGPVATSGRES